MAERAAESLGSEVVDTVVKSGLSGVAATVLAVTVFSPAGFGGMIGTSLASGFGNDSNASATQDPYAVLPAYPAPLSAQELDQIQSTLARTATSLEITRAATDDRIERMRSLAVNEETVTFARVTPAAAPQAARPAEDLRLTLSEPASVEAPVAVEARAIPTSFSVGGSYAEPYHDPHMELAELMLAYESH